MGPLTKKVLNIYVCVWIRTLKKVDRCLLLNFQLFFIFYISILLFTLYSWKLYCMGVFDFWKIPNSTYFKLILFIKRKRKKKHDYEIRGHFFKNDASPLLLFWRRPWYEAIQKKKYYTETFHNILHRTMLHFFQRLFKRRFKKQIVCTVH